MSRAIIAEFNTVKEAEAYLKGIIDGRDLIDFGEERFDIFDDRKYCGKWTVNVE